MRLLLPYSKSIDYCVFLELLDMVGRQHFTVMVFGLDLDTPCINPV